ncbi:ABC transporter permease subunit [Hydrogenibacillus sp. N12]|uniref:ABC transporter permease n=1 Tax=Hydrogenibacillus sp. N12 TaxID=2866627 RepID=UPI001C7C9E74|nr:ABC transporter permease subunit [Hydrogenibacillus sp. N12]QZA33400.1 ABC transporter permease [Hydrogenibacillus sp. N12]
MRRSLSVLFRKEVADHLHSWRFNILIALIVLTTLASLYTAAQTIRSVVPQADQPLGDTGLFLKLFTTTDGKLPSFVAFVGFLAPLLGLGMAFDAISSERNKGTLVRLLSQPIYRDDVILAKWFAALSVVGVFFLALGFIVMGLGLFVFGIPPTAEEVLRIVFFLLVTAVYVAVWQSLAILFSIRFRQAATSVLAGLSVWLFFSLFYPMIVNLIAPITGRGTVDDVLREIGRHQFLSRLSPVTLYEEATTILLSPDVRALGPFTLEQAIGAIPTPLPFDQSLLLIWPQIAGLVAMSVVLFGLSFVLFMRQDIRGR